MREFWYSGVISAGVPSPRFLTLYFLTGVAQLTAYRVLMVWVYDRTDVLTVALWVVVVAIAVANGGQVSGSPIRLRRV